MNPNKLVESGMIGADGRLRLPMDRINAYAAANKGKRIIARFQAVEPGSTEAQKAYYYSYILPTVQAAEWDLGNRMTEEAVDSFLIGQYPFDKETADGNAVTAGRELNQKQMSDFIDWLKMFAAQNYSVYIEDSKSI